MQLQREFKDRLLEIFKWFHAFCEENRLRYYMIGGTMLGAIRHGGFIPWDDDIDVAMPRSDYERLIDLTEGRVFSSFVVESPRSEAKDFIYSYAKVYDTRTTLIENDRRTVKRGIYLDVFPLDGIGSNYEESVNNYKPISMRLDFLASRVVAVRAGRKWYKNLAVRLAQCIPDCFVDEKQLIRKINQMCAMRSFDEYEYVGNLVSTWRSKELMRRKNFGTPTLYEFEGMKVYGVQDYEAYLSTLYGDWRKLPPEEKRVSNHENLHYDLDNSYLS